jgi:hypothetical protein
MPESPLTGSALRWSETVLKPTPTLKTSCPRGRGNGRTYVRNRKVSRKRGGQIGIEKGERQHTSCSAPQLPRSLTWSPALSGPYLEPLSDGGRQKKGEPKETKHSRQEGQKCQASAYNGTDFRQGGSPPVTSASLSKSTPSLYTSPVQGNSALTFPRRLTPFFSVLLFCVFSLQQTLAG